MNGIPDAVVEAAWREWNQKHAGERASFLAGFAAAEGPWREHLAADAEALKSGMLGTSQFAYGYRTACVDLAARIIRGTNE